MSKKQTQTYPSNAVGARAIKAYRSDQSDMTDKERAARRSNAMRLIYGGDKAGKTVSTGR